MLLDHLSESMDGGVAREIALPEILLAAAVVLISPLWLWMAYEGGTFAGALNLLGSFVVVVILSMAYLHMISPARSHESRTLSEGERGPAHGTALFIKYDLVVLTYGIFFVLSMGVTPSLPYLVWLAFLPFHSAMVLAITIYRRDVQPAARFRIRVLLSLLFFAFGIAWPFQFVQHLYFT